MRIYPALAVFFIGVYFASSSFAVETETGASPEELNRRAFRLGREGQRLAMAGENKEAWEKFSAAAELTKRIEREHPAWQPELIAVRGAEYRDRAAALAELAFSLPEGYVRLSPAMSRLGNRPALGRTLAARVEEEEEDNFSVVGYMVEVTRVASLLGAGCNCPDFMVRGAVEGYACRHIWAVIFARRLLERSD